MSQLKAASPATSCALTPANSPANSPANWRRAYLKATYDTGLGACAAENLPGYHTSGFMQHHG